MEETVFAWSPRTFVAKAARPSGGDDDFTIKAENAASRLDKHICKISSEIPPSYTHEGGRREGKF